MLSARIHVKDAPCEVDPTVVVASLDITRDRSLDYLKIGSVQPIAIRRGPLFVLEVQGEATAIYPSERGHVIRCGHRREGFDELPALIAPAADEVAIEPDQIGIVVQVAGRQIVDVSLLEDPAKKIDGLVQGVQSVNRIEFRPESLEHLVPRAGHIRARKKEAQERENLSSNSRSLNAALAHADQHPILILYHDWGGESSRQSMSKVGGAGEFALAPSVHTETLYVRLVADGFQQSSCGEAPTSLGTK